MMAEETAVRANLAEASRFLDFMAEGEEVTFQTFDDTKGKSTLARIIHGTLDHAARQLVKLNDSGAGIYWMVNYGNGKGRSTENVTGVRCLFLDLDGSPLKPVLAAGIEPHAVVESSPGKWHVYWCVSGCTTERFKPLQRALAAKFAGDPSVHDLPRVLRVPGFIHRKGEPFETRIHSLQPFQPYDVDELVARLELDVIDEPPARTAPQAPAGGRALVLEGSRHEHLRRRLADLNWRGIPEAGIRAAMHEINERECSPPKERAQVDVLVTDWLKRYSAQTGKDETGPGAGLPPSPEAAEWVQAVREWQPPQNLKDYAPQVRFAVEGLIQAGKVGALVAAGGTGKTTLLLILAICIATGRQFFSLNVQRGSFVLLSNDDAQEDLTAALARVGQAMELGAEEWAAVNRSVRVVSLQGLAGLRTFTMAQHGDAVETGLEELILQAVEGIPDLVGIALDTLRQFSGGNSNDEQVIKHTIAGATAIAVKTGAFVILPHHTGKQNFRDGITDMYAGSGSAAIADNCRFVLLLQTTTWADIEAKVQRTGQEQGSPLVLTSTRGSLLVRAPEPIFLHRDGFAIERVAGGVLTHDQQLDKRDREILAAVRMGCSSRRAVHAQIRGKKDAVLRAINDLIARGLLAEDVEGGSRGGSLGLIVSAAGGRFLENFE